MAAEYAVKAKEAYDKVAEHGEQTVRAWRGEVSEEIVDIAVVVEPEPETAAGPEAAEAGAAEASASEEKPAAKKPAARKAPAKKAAAASADES